MKIGTLKRRWKMEEKVEELIEELIKKIATHGMKMQEFYIEKLENIIKTIKFPLKIRYLSIKVKNGVCFRSEILLERIIFEKSGKIKMVIINKGEFKEVITGNINDIIQLSF
jgi:hypothetical protein